LEKGGGRGDNTRGGGSQKTNVNRKNLLPTRKRKIGRPQLVRGSLLLGREKRVTERN